MSNLEKYQSKNIIVKYLLKRFLIDIINLINLPSVKTILDAGCGEGFIIRKIKGGYPELDITGVDIDSRTLQIAEKLNPGVKFKKADINQLPLNNNEFDLVLALEILEHLKSPENALKEIKRVSKKYLIISVPWEPYFRIGNFLRGKNLPRLGNDPGHIQHFSKRKIKKIIEKYFKIIKIKISFPWIIIYAEK